VSEVRRKVNASDEPCRKWMDEFGELGSHGYSRTFKQGLSMAFFGQLDGISPVLLQF
jgi:hypothetical protein